MKYPDRIIVRYPQKQGFTLLAHDLLKAIRQRFAVYGHMAADVERFALELDQVCLYICTPEHPADIDLAALLELVGQRMPAVTTAPSHLCLSWTTAKTRTINSGSTGAAQGNGHGPSLSADKQTP
jgi:DNA-binding IclR family transcriptional regulator